MDAEQTYDASTIKSKKSPTNHPTLANPGQSVPTTFFLKSEKEMEKDTQRGRHVSQRSTDIPSTTQGKTTIATLSDSSFGVQSLEETIGSAFLSQEGLTRTSSNSSEATTEDRSDGGTPVVRKRKTGNPVHPKASATGHRVIPSERTSHSESHGTSPTSLNASSSALPTHRRRRGSATSSINVSQPMTPLKISPHPESATPSTLRSASPKSFRLSDEEGSVADETNSQAVMSSSGDEDEDHSLAGRLPQLVMPSLTMPARRPFTENGRNMGRARVLLLGPKGVGKTSLMQSIFRTCEDIVHVDPKTTTEQSQISQSANGSTYQSTDRVTEVFASTRPYPSWWGGESLRLSQSRRSFGEGVLERNLTFIDTPGIQSETDAQSILDYYQAELRRATNLDGLSESDMLHLLSGDGGVQIDAAMYIFDPALVSADQTLTGHSLGVVHQELLRYLSRYSNFIPLIGRADTVSPEQLAMRKAQILQLLETLGVSTYQFPDNRHTTSDSVLTSQAHIHDPFAVSSAIGDDAEVIDASILMSSQYMQPLIPSELPEFIDCLLSPRNVRQRRHSAAVKFVAWRRACRRIRVDLHQQTCLQSPVLGFEGSESACEGPSRVLVPYGSASYYRSTSPSISEVSGLSSNVFGGNISAVAKYNEQSPPSEPFRQVRLAKWAQDLQRSLHNEGRRYREMYNQRPGDWTSEEDDEKHDGHALVPTKDPRRPPRGRLGGDLGVIDPLDPLGVLALGQAFQRHGIIAIQVAGSCGLLSAVAFWILRHWTDVQDFFGFGQPITMVHVAAVPPPTRPMLGWLDEVNLRSLLGWAR